MLALGLLVLRGGNADRDGARPPIEEIAIGDLVAARDGFTGEVGWRPVRELFRRTAPSIAHVTLDGPDGRRETLHVTSEHPFFVGGKGWVEVRRLERGDRIVSEREATLAVAEVSLEERPTLVYNFEVAQDHNYFVGDEGAEAHNAPFDWNGSFWKNLPKRRGKFRLDDLYLYYKDYTHGDLECFNRKTRSHEGSRDPTDGSWTKGPAPDGRRGRPEWPW